MRTDFFKIDSSYKVLYRMISDRFGKECAADIFTAAQKELSALFEQYSDIPKGDHAHTDRYIFPRIAMLRSMQHRLGGSAMPIMDELIRSEGSKAGSLMHKITALPLMNRAFLKIFARMAKNQFGEKSGFRQKFYDTPNNTVKFDILDCPYCRYCNMCGCPELIHTFCDSDYYCFGNLSRIDFIREQTLEHGEKCDFTLIRR